MTDAARGGAAVLVVGAGPTGLMLACELARHGTPVRIVDLAPEPSATSKALAVQARTLEVFDLMGIADEAVRAGTRFNGMNIYLNGVPSAHMDLSQVDSPYPFALGLPQADTERLLDGHLCRLGYAVERGVRLTGFTQDGDSVTAQLQHPNGSTETVQTPWIVGCDGAHSTVRHTLNFPFEGSSYPEGWALADCRIASPLARDEAYVFLDDRGAGHLVAIFPVGHQYQRVMLQTTRDAGAGPLPQPTPELIQSALDTSLPVKAQIEEIGWLSAFRCHLRHAPQLRAGRAFLAGDAAHIHSPAGGQGMNTGLQDAHNLAWKLALVERGHAPDSLLDTYADERIPVAEGVLRMSDAMLRMISTDNPVFTALRRHLYPMVSSIEPLRQSMADRIAEIDIRYRRSPIVAEHVTGIPGFSVPLHAPHAGDRAPDASPLSDGVRSLRLFDLLRTPRHTLLLFAGTHPHADTIPTLRTIARTVQERYPDLITTHIIAAGDAPVAAGEAATAALPRVPELLRDPQGVVHHRYGAERGALYLIRPDGYIGFRSYPPDLADLQGYLGRVLS